MNHSRIRLKATHVAAATLSIGIGLSIGKVPVASGPSARQESHIPDREQHGRQIYVLGTSPSGKTITAVVGSRETELSASTVACASCHGLAGQGTTEGGVTASNLTWESLTRPYDVTTPTGRRHGPYSEATFKRAVTMGLDPAGNRLHVAMPRFRISLEDADALIAYIKKLGHTSDPGITDSTVRVATLIPADGPLADAGMAVRAALQAYLSELNDRGGLYGRKFELLASSNLTREGVRGFILGQGIFAVISPLIPGSEKELLPLFEEEQVPLIGPFTYLPQLEFPINRHIFYLYTGLEDQGRALCNFAAKNLGGPAVAIVAPNQGLAAGLPAVLRERCNALNLKMAAEISLREAPFDADGLVSRLVESGADTVIFLGTSEQTLELASAAARRGWRPKLLLVGSLEAQELFNLSPAFAGKAFVAYPTIPSDWSPERLRGFAAMAEKHHLSPRHTSSQISAVSATDIFIEGLRRVGKDLSREKLIEQLEGLNRYSTGLTPAITFGPNRRVGALGAYVVVLNNDKKQFEPAGTWVPLD